MQNSFDKSSEVSNNFALHFIMRSGRAFPSAAPNRKILNILLMPRLSRNIQFSVEFLRKKDVAEEEEKTKELKTMKRRKNSILFNIIARTLHFAIFFKEEN